MTAGSPDLSYDDLLGLIYEGPLEDRPWQSALPQLRKMLDAQVASLVVRPPSDEDQGAILNSGNKCKALDQFGIPAGLAYMQREKTAKYDCPSKSDILPDEVLHELLDLASIKPEKKKKRKKKQTKTKKYSKGGKQTKRRNP